MEKELLEILSKYKGKDIIITQMGFMQAEYTINNLNYNVEEDMLMCRGNNKTYVTININMINKIVHKDDELIIYLDNDTILKYKS